MSNLTQFEKQALIMSKVEDFIAKHRITCAETIYQTDRVIEDATCFIEDLCEICGYLSIDE